MRERRFSPRVNANLLVHFSHFKRYTQSKTRTTVICTRGEKAFSRTLDVSYGGMLLELNHRLPKETYLDLRISIENQIVKATGVIVHVRQMGDQEKFGIGIKFISMPAEHRQTLHNFILRKLDTRNPVLPA